MAFSKDNSDILRQAIDAYETALKKESGKIISEAAYYANIFDDALRKVVRENSFQARKAYERAFLDFSNALEKELSAMAPETWQSIQILDRILKSPKN